MDSPIFVYAHLDSRGKELLKAQLPNEQLHFANRLQLSEADRAVMHQAEIAFGTLPAKLLSVCPRLRWMQLESVGFEYYQNQKLSPALKISNLKGMFEKPAAETALAGLLALARGLRRLIPAQQASQWIELEVRPETWLLHGKRVVVLGAGSIGRRTRILLEVFECNVQMFARNNPDASLRTLPELIAQVAQCDIIVCCLPKTTETIGLVSREVLAAMSPTCIFVNVGRGAVVDEVALVELLQKRLIGGAVLDVTHREPIPPEDPLWNCPNTVLTQHTGGGYDDELLDKARFFLKNLQLYRSGQPVLNLINLEQGY